MMARALGLAVAILVALCEGKDVTVVINGLSGDGRGSIAGGTLLRVRRTKGKVRLQFLCHYSFNPAGRWLWI